MLVTVIAYILALQLLAKERIDWQWAAGLIAAIPYSVLVTIRMIMLTGHHQPFFYAFTTPDAITLFAQLGIALVICRILSHTDDLTTWLFVGGLGLFGIVFAAQFLVMIFF